MANKKPTKNIDKNKTSAVKKNVKTITSKEVLKTVNVSKLNKVNKSSKTKILLFVGLATVLVLSFLGWYFRINIKNWFR